jgi:hypothetical protein
MWLVEVGDRESACSSWRCEDKGAPSCKKVVFGLIYMSFPLKSKLVVSISITPKVFYVVVIKS